MILDKNRVISFFNVKMNKMKVKNSNYCVITPKMKFEMEENARIY